MTSPNYDDDDYLRPGWDEDYDDDDVGGDDEHRIADNRERARDMNEVFRRGALS